MNSIPEINIIKQNLEKLYRTEYEQREQLRLKIKEDVTEVLRNFFLNYPGCEVWLSGSIVKEFSFSTASDIDIAVKGFRGSRLDLYTELEAMFSLPVDLIIMERSNISGEIIRYGERIF